MLPRTAGLFESFKKLPPLRNLQGANWVAALADPDIRQTFQTLMDLAGEYKTWQAAYAEVGRLVLSRGAGKFFIRPGSATIWMKNSGRLALTGNGAAL